MNPFSYKAYLFDFDFTLADASEGIVHCFEASFAGLGLPRPDPAAVKQLIGLPLAGMFAQLTGTEDPEAARAFCARYAREADRIMTAQTRLYPDTKAVLSRLARNGRVGIVSTKPRRRIEATFRQEGLLPLLSVLIGGDDVAAAKPDPEGLFLALRRLELAREQVLFVGDSLSDAGAAKNAGVDFAAVLTGTTQAAAFNGYPQVACGNSLNEVFGL